LFALSEAVGGAGKSCGLLASTRARIASCGLVTDTSTETGRSGRISDSTALITSSTGSVETTG